MNQKTIEAYLKGEVSQQEKEQIMHWVEESTENRKLFLQYRKLYDTAIWNNANEDIKTTQKYKKSFISSYITQFMKVAAVVVLTIGSTLIYLNINQKQTIYFTQTIEVPQGQHVNLTLSDGTKVSLNSNSKFSFPSDFEADNRTVKLDGEGYFDVAHNTKRPFHVLTNKCDVVVLGTTFNVIAYSKSDVFETALIEGSVRISNLANSKKITLKPNEKVLLENGSFKGTTFKSDDQFLWRKGIYAFRNESLTEIFKKLSSYYNIKIHIRNKDADSVKCTGKFRQIDGLEHILKVLQSANDFKYKINEVNNEITIK